MDAFECFWMLLDAFWGPLRGPTGALARSWVSLGGSGDAQGALFLLLGGSWGGFGRLQGLLGILLGCLGARLVVLNGVIRRFL